MTAGPPLAPVPAPPSERFVAELLDCVIGFVATFVLLRLFLDLRILFAWPALVVLAQLAASEFGNGQTLGRRAAGIELLSYPTGGRLSRRLVAARCGLGAGFTALLAMGALILGYQLILGDKTTQDFEGAANQIIATLGGFLVSAVTIAAWGVIQARQVKSDPVGRTWTDRALGTTVIKPTPRTTSSAAE